jgi:hypothetical protein
MAWYNASWTKRKKITIQSSKVPTTASDFSVYVKLDDLGTDFWAGVKNGGGDIRITKADGTTELAREVVSCDTGTSKGELYFKADSISSSANTDFYIYYGNSGASDYAVSGTYGARAVWSGHVGVWHLKETSGSAVNSASASYSGTFNGGLPDSVAGKIGNAQDCDGDGDYVNIGNVGITENWTMNFWAKSHEIGENPVYFPVGLTTSADNGIGMGGYYVPVDNKIYVFDGTNLLKGTTDVSEDVWYFITVVKNGSTYYLYVNGSLEASGTLNDIDISDLRLGRRSGTDAWYFNGVIDEARVADTTRTTNWITTEYNNQNSPSTFYSVGGQETYTDINKALAYSVKTEKEKTEAVLYSVLKEQPIILSLAYSVVAYPEATKVISYCVLASGEQTAEIDYLIIAEKELTLGVDYSVKQWQEITKVLSYEVVAKNEALQSLAYAVRGSGVLDEGLTYQVVASVDLERDLSYFVLVLGAVELDLSYSVVAGGGNTKGLQYFVKLGAEITKDLSYFAKPFSVVELGLDYEVFTFPEKTEVLEYRILKTAGIELGLDYSILKKNKKELQLNYEILFSGAVNRPLSYSVFSSSQIDLGIDYSIGFVFEEIKGLEYSISAGQSINRGLRYSVKTTEEKTKALSYFIGRELSGTKGLEYFIFKEKKKNLAVSYSVEKIREKTKIVDYYVGWAVDIEKELEYSIHPSARLPLVYTVFTSPEKTKTILYFVEVNPYSDEPSPYSKDCLADDPIYSPEITPFSKADNPYSEKAGSNPFPRP